MLKFLNNIKKKSVNFSQMIGLSELTSGRWSKAEQLNAYTLSSYVYSCVRLRAEKVGEIAFQLNRGEKEITEHPLLSLLYKPNALQNKNEFFENYQMHKDLTGSVFVYLLRVGGVIKEMHLLRPDGMTIQLDSAGTQIVSFKYRTPKGEERLFKPEEILFSLSTSPFSPLEGVSPLSPGQQSVDTELQLSEYQSKVLKNGGRVEGVFTFKTERLSQDQIEEIKRQFKEHHSEAKNAGKPLVLYGDTDYKNLGLSPTEMSYLESKRLTRDDILLLYRVPKPLLAQTDDVNLASAKMAKEIFLSETIKPLLGSLTQKLNEFLIPDEFELTFIDPTPEDVDLNLKRIESGIKNYYLTINEARAAEGYDPVPEGDKILIPFNLVTLEEGVEPTPEPTPAPPAIEEDPEVPEEDEEEPEEEVESKHLKRLAHPLSDEVKRKAYAEAWIKTSDSREKKFRIELKRYWQQQLGRLIERLDSVPKQRKKGLLEETWTPEIEVSAAKEWMLPLIREFLVESGQNTVDLFGAGGQFSLTSTLQTSLAQKAEIFARSINDTTFTKLQSEFIASVEASENRQQLIKRVRETYGDISKSRAQTIARTEVTSASQLGIISGYEQSGLEIKIWVATQDASTRDSHSLIDGEERNIHQPFTNGLQFPGDSTGSAEEVINCRCTI